MLQLSIKFKLHSEEQKRGHKRLFSKTINKQRRIQANKTQSQGGRPSIKRNGLKDQMKIQEKFRFK